VAIRNCGRPRSIFVILAGYHPKSEQLFSLVGSCATRHRAIRQIADGLSDFNNWKHPSDWITEVMTASDDAFHPSDLFADARTAIFRTLIGGALFTRTRPAAKDARNRFG
jgi:hypothetical protein